MKESLMPLKDWYHKVIKLCLLIAVITIGVFFRNYDSAKAEQISYPARYSILEIQLWPEYEYPSVWVSYTLQLEDDSNYPAMVSLRIPTAAGIPNYVAVGPSRDTLFEVPFQRKVDGEWSFITFFSTEPIIRLEYDDPNLVIDGTYREYQHIWYKDYEVENIYLQVQQPYGVRTLNVISPFKEEVWFNDEILRYYSAQLNKNEIEDKVTINLAYQKESNEVTVERLQVKSRIPISENTPGRINWWSSFPWVIVSLISLFLIGVGLLGMGNLNILKREKPTQIMDINQKTEETEKLQKLQSNDNKAELYCPQCGNRVRSKDRYCRVCGAHL